jgi:hypothetical protein
MEIMRLSKMGIKQYEISETKMHHIKLSFFLACFEEILLFNLFLKYSVVNL